MVHDAGASDSVFALSREVHAGTKHLQSPLGERVRVQGDSNTCSQAVRVDTTPKAVKS